MSHTNLVVFEGVVQREPDYRCTSGGTAVLTLRLQNITTFEDRNGDQRESRCTMDAKFFGKRADRFRDVNEGDVVQVTAKLRTESWDGPDGQRQFRTMLQCEDLSVRGSAVPARNAPSRQAEEPDDDLPF